MVGIKKGDENELQKAVAENGPVTVAIDSRHSSFQVNIHHKCFKSLFVVVSLLPSCTHKLVLFRWDLLRAQLFKFSTNTHNAGGRI